MMRFGTVRQVESVATVGEAQVTAGPVPASPPTIMLGRGSTTSRVLELQRAIGNAAVARLLQRTPGDTDEYAQELAQKALQTGNDGTAQHAMWVFFRAHFPQEVPKLSGSSYQKDFKGWDLVERPKDGGYAQLVAGSEVIRRIAAGKALELARELSPKLAVLDRHNAARPPTASNPKKAIDYVFIMGVNTSGKKRTDAFYNAARKHFIDMNAVPGATVLEVASLEGIVDTVAAGPGPVGDLYIVVHATPIGVEFALHKNDRGDQYAGRIWLDKLQPESAALGRQIAPKMNDRSAIRIRGCNVGRNKKFVAELHKALGGKGTLEAPTHRTTYDWETTRRKVTSTSEYVGEHVVIFPNEKQHMSYKPADLAPIFAKKYAMEGLTEADWLTILKTVKPRAIVKTYTWDVDIDATAGPVTDDAVADVMRGNINEPSEFTYKVTRPNARKGVVNAQQIRYEVRTKDVVKIKGGSLKLPSTSDVEYATFMTTDVAPRTPAASP
jgi:hypothetical protein